MPLGMGPGGPNRATTGAPPRQMHRAAAAPHKGVRFFHAPHMVSIGSGGHK